MRQEEKRVQQHKLNPGPSLESDPVIDKKQKLLACPIPQLRAYWNMETDAKAYSKEDIIKLYLKSDYWECESC
jgi:hypothetical protein